MPSVAPSPSTWAEQTDSKAQNLPWNLPCGSTCAIALSHAIARCVVVRRFVPWFEAGLRLVGLLPVRLAVPSTLGPSKGALSPRWGPPLWGSRRLRPPILWLPGQRPLRCKCPQTSQANGGRGQQSPACKIRGRDGGHGGGVSRQTGARREKCLIYSGTRDGKRAGSVAPVHCAVPCPTRRECRTEIKYIHAGLTSTEPVGALRPHGPFGEPGVRPAVGRAVALCACRRPPRGPVRQRVRSPRGLEARRTKVLRV